VLMQFDRSYRRPGVHHRRRRHHDEFRLPQADACFGRGAKVKSARDIGQAADRPREDAAGRLSAFKNPGAPRRKLKNRRP